MINSPGPLWKNLSNIMISFEYYILTSGNIQKALSLEKDGETILWKLF